ncbi:hypothetical protein MTR67_038397 [Solanum verrucosum]|uniref:Reverse transcriptase Ty1/copia-type domain-containing protein n=1 Tax=Solanum verrucosum TaxID=315347 RepID=A0AAF0UFF0_SOLVR|nr:hypothetical protein MTR67_038397 [Solanum verrucosum]
MAFVRLLISMAAMNHWPLFQLDIKNALLRGELVEEVYMEQPPGFVAQGESRLVCKLRRSLYGLKQSPRAWFGHFRVVVQQFGMIQIEVDHFVFYKHSSHDKHIFLIVYVDDIVITRDDHEGIAQFKQHLSSHFQTKDLGKLKYFLGIEVAQSCHGIAITPRKYALDILEDAGMLDCKPVDSPMDPNTKLSAHLDGLFYNQLVIVTGMQRYIRSSPEQGLLYEDRGHTNIVGYSDVDWAGSPSDRRSTTSYFVLIGGNLMSWKSKKQVIIARSSTEAKYRAMALATCELIWLRQLLQELKMEGVESMTLICDNQVALHIASHAVLHERMNHIEIDCHFIREKIEFGYITTSFVNSKDQLVDIFKKSLRGSRIDYICGKLGAYDLYAPA